MKVQTRILQAKSDWERFAVRKVFGYVVTAPVTLKVLSWNVAGLSEDSTDIFMSQISMLTDWDVLLLQQCFKKTGWSEGGWCTQNYSRRANSWETAMPSSHHASEMEWSIKSCRSEQMDCGRAGWTDDCHFSPFASHRKEIGGFRGGFDGHPGFHEWETATAPDPGRKLQCELVRIDRLSSCGRVDPKTKNADGHERLTACASLAHCRGRN